jgi:hypothetical protein
MLSVYILSIRRFSPVLSTLEDRKIFHDLLRVETQRQRLSESPGEVLLSVAANFLARPFAAGTLEQGGRERLIINLRQLDCFTFVENTAVLARLIKAGTTSFADFAASLKATRYRQGLLNGYSSRLHYFSDWIYDCEAKGFLQDITRQIGGERLHKNINFMTAHLKRYPALKRLSEYSRMLTVEKACSARPLYHIPKEGLRACADKINNGDLIAITTDTEGLDVTHAGIAVHKKRGLHLLHASQRAGKVIVSEETLYGDRKSVV